jgi:hypothetical protein
MPDFTVPLSGAMNTRISAANALSAESGVWGAGVWGDFIWGASAQSSDKDERFINCFLTKMGAKEYILKRPGAAALNTPSSGNIGSAILVWTGNGAGTAVITAFGATNSTIYSGTSSLGAITGKASQISETFVTTTATLVVPSSDSTAWYYDTGAAVMTQITDGQFPGNAGFTLAGGFAHMDGFAFIMTTDGKLWSSDINSVTAWTSNNYDPNNAYPDKGVGCVRYKNYVMAFGGESVQFYVNRGLSPFPLVNVPSMTSKIGAVSWDAIATLSDSVFWAGATPQGGISILMFDGQVSRISTPEQDVPLGLAGPTNISLTTLRVYGRSMVLVKANTRLFVYVIEDKRWHEWTATNPLFYKCAGTSVGSQTLTYSISNQATTGKVYVVDPAQLVFTDDGAAFTATIQSGGDDYGTSRRKFFETFEVEADVEPSTSDLTVAFSDDDFQTWETAGTIDLSSQTHLTRLGATNPDYGNKRAWKLSHSANTAMRLAKLRGRLSVGR